MKPNRFSQQLEFEFLRILLVGESATTPLEPEIFNSSDVDLTYELIKGAFASEHTSTPLVLDYVDLIEVFGYGAVRDTLS